MSEHRLSVEGFDGHQEQEDIAAGSIVALPMEEDLARALEGKDSMDAAVEETGMVSEPRMLGNSHAAEGSNTSQEDLDFAA